MTRRALRHRAGGPLSYLLHISFFAGVLAQVAATVFQQHHRLVAQLAQAAAHPQVLGRTTGQAALVFVLDVLGVIFLLPAAMIRADGIAGKQRAAVDTELWLTLPLDGRQRVVARLGQATFFLSLLSFFLFSHFLGPALAFGKGALSAALLFFALCAAALLLILGGGLSGYALCRRYLSPRRQGQLVAWAGLSLAPLGYAYYLVARGHAAEVPAAAAAAGALAGSPVARLLVHAYRGDGVGALGAGALLLSSALLVFAGGWRLVQALFREAADDVSPLVAPRRYPLPPGVRRPLSHLHKDLLLSLRDPIHRGIFVSSVLVVLLPLASTLLAGERLLLLLRTRLGEANVLSIATFLVGLAVLISAGQWMPLEARALEWLRVSGIEPRELVYRKARGASLQALLLSVPVSALLLRYGPLRLQPLLLPAYALLLCWFMVGDTAARFPQARRDTRPVQLRSLYAGYLLVLLTSILLPLSRALAALSLLLLLLLARRRLRAGVRALQYLDDVMP